MKIIRLKCIKIHTYNVHIVRKKGWESTEGETSDGAALVLETDGSSRPPFSAHYTNPAAGTAMKTSIEVLLICIDV